MRKRRRKRRIRKKAAFFKVFHQAIHFYCLKTTAKKVENLFKRLKKKERKKERKTRLAFIAQEKKKGKKTRHAVKKRRKTFFKFLSSPSFSSLLLFIYSLLFHLFLSSSHVPNFFCKADSDEMRSGSPALSIHVVVVHFCNEESELIIG